MFQLTCLRFDKDNFNNVVHSWTDAVFDNYFDIALNRKIERQTVE